MAGRAWSYRGTFHRFANRWLGRLKTQTKTRLGFERMEERLAPAVYNVTSNADSGLGTLRAALISAGITLENDTIDIGVTGNILLTSGELKIPGGVTLNGPTTGNVTVNGIGSSRVFNTSDAPTGSIININRVTVAGGAVTGSGAGLLIGDEIVTLTDCTFNGNKATGDGGGIHVTQPAGTLNLNSCFLTGNQALGAGNDGGAISLQLASALTMDKCTVSGNSAADNGAGIYFRQGGKFTITNSTINANVAGSASTSIGGGLYFFGTASGPLYMQNCTISGNQSGGAGGGIVLANFTGGLNLVSCTITKNSATSAGITGGGLARTGGTGAVGMTSTIIAGNTSQSGIGPDVSFNTVANITGEYNLIGVGNSGNAVFEANNLQGTKASPLDAKLGALAYNGGSTATHRPLSGSPAIDKGFSTLEFDQRGVSRNVGKSADVGSVEFADSFLVTNINDNGAGSLRRAVDDSNLDLGIFNGINFDATVFATAKTIKLTTGELKITEGCLINGSSNVTIDANFNSRHFNIDGTGSFNVGIFNMTLIHGNGSGGDGGSIRIVDDTVFLQEVVVMNNSMDNGEGGGIAILGPNANVTLERCTISDNSADGFFSSGGGIYSSGSKLTVQHSRISGNLAYEDGGGIYSKAGGTLTITDSTIDNNISNFYWAGTGGGGVYFFGINDGGGLTILNSTISGNQSQSFSHGGGVSLAGSVDNVVIRNSTITGNSAASKGGGLFRYGNTGSLTIESTIIAGNTAGDSSKALYMQGSVNAVRSAIDSLAGIGSFTADATTNSLVGVNLKLGPLTNNGGSLPTHLPALDSPLINQGFNPANQQYDQRGVGYLRARTGVADIGATEAATNLVVTNNNNSGAGSLRQAVLDANALVGADIITFDPAFFNSQKTITLTSGNMEIDEAVTIAGPGSSLVTVNANLNGRIFDTVNAPTGAAIDISGMTLTGGKAVQGGAIRVSDEQLNVAGCVFSGNVSLDNGGAVSLIFGGGMTASNCTFSGNFANIYGGAIFASLSTPVLFLNGCTVSGNQASSGGGIYSSSVLSIESSTVSGNQATAIAGGGQGGGILISNYGISPITVRNSTISGNKAQNDGGGIGFRPASSAILIVQNSTITANTSTNGKGGGIARSASYAINIDSSIVAGNSNAIAKDISSPGTVNANKSAIGDAAGFSLTGANNLAFGVDLKLGPLANNGGATYTHALLPGSPAMNKGSNPANLMTDQRGMARVQGGAVDIGAYESDFAAPAKVTSVEFNNGDTQRSRVTSLRIKFDQMIPNPPGSAFQLTRQGDNAVVTLNSAGAPMTDEVLITFTGGPLDSGSLADGKYTLTTFAAQINGGVFDGDGDGQAGGDYVLVGNAGNKLFRLFGDADGNGVITANDFNAFRLAYGQSGPSIFDFDNDGSVSASDFNQFRLRYGMTI